MKIDVFRWKASVSKTKTELSETITVELSVDKFGHIGTDLPKFRKFTQSLQSNQRPHCSYKTSSKATEMSEVGEFLENEIPSG